MYCSFCPKLSSSLIFSIFVVAVTNYIEVLGDRFCNGNRIVVYRSRCRECSYNSLLRCPDGYTHLTPGAGIQSFCYISLHFRAWSTTIFTRGCHHLCARNESYEECCNGYWGHDCQACPGNPACTGAGKCSDKKKGNGTCTCQDGFGGFACEMCTADNMFGPRCDQNCICSSRGECDTGVNGTGHCEPYTCQIGYEGKNCDQRLPACHHNMSCGANASCFNINSTDSCICNPGYTGNGQVCTVINPCNGSGHGCHGDAQCIFTSPGHYKCQCKDGYTGDGTVCMVIDPCQNDNGGCPTNSTRCNFLGPAMSNCSCLHGFEHYRNDSGCALIDLCNDGNKGGCDVNADCIMAAPLQRRCLCKDGFRGNLNETHCYGNLLQRLKDLNANGPTNVNGTLSLATQIMSHSLALALTVSGPFTVFVPTDSAIYSSFSMAELSEFQSNPDFAAHVARVHIVAADLDSVNLKIAKVMTTLQGTNVTATEENGMLYVQVQNQPSKAKITASDFLAGNGIIHIINKAMRYPGSYVLYNTVSSLDVIQQKSELSSFGSLLQLSGVDNLLVGSPVTVLCPSNKALSGLDNTTINYLTTTAMGKQKLISLLKYHIIDMKIKIEDLVPMKKIPSIEGSSIIVKRTKQGLFVLGDKSRVIETDIASRDGIIHVIDKPLIPADALPLVPKYCNIISYRDENGLCYQCNIINSFPNRGCRPGYQPLVGKEQCSYRITYRLAGGGLVTYRFSGCRTKTCRKIVETPECCSGFYGRACHACPGPFSSPCNRNGNCSDKMGGTGRCKCYPVYKGTACEMCKQPGKFGPYCNQTCTCVHGTCSDGPFGNGTCKIGSCQDGFHGDNCDMRDTPCSGSSPLVCHIHAHCVQEYGVDKCKCNAGYEGSGQRCYEIDPCAKPERGECDANAICTKTGPNLNKCTCESRYRGDGRVCEAIDLCVEPGRGGCHDNAICQYTGPAQAICTCKSGYTGNGQNCSEINNCLVNNGGCSAKARCDRTGPATHNCTCFLGYIGDGYSCLGSIATVVEDNSNLKRLNDVIKNAHLEYYLANQTTLMTFFAPSSSAIASLTSEESSYWTASNERLEYLVKYHLAANKYSSAALRNMSKVVVMNGLSLSVEYAHGRLILNGAAELKITNISAANGIVHIIDKVLLPPHLPPTPELPTLIELIKNISDFSDFYNISQQYNIISALSTCEGCTIFIPTNQALRTFLQHRSVTAEILKYHVIGQYLRMKNVYNGQQFSTYLGENYLLRITDGSKVNGIKFEPQMLKARRSVVYRLYGVLVPVESRCDFETKYKKSFFALYLPIQVTDASCPGNLTYVTFRCVFYRFMCNLTCQVTYLNKKCCKGFWGTDCQACPGDVTTPCLGNGQCSDGTSGNGHCDCHANFTGTACEKCVTSKYGKNCTERCQCKHGLCSEGPSGDGSCWCDHGWKGKRCNQSANYTNCLPTVCHRHSTCYGNGSSARCVCDVDYIGNGTYCRAIHPCDTNNGGCHSKATCLPKLTHTSLAVCTCVQGYTGDGQYCQEINLCQVGNGGCHANATCSKTGPAMRSCHCKVGFTGDGLVECTEINPCDYENGGCSIRAYCKKTSPGQNKCTCAKRYVGNGRTCVGSCMEVVTKDPELSILANKLKKRRLDRLLKALTSISLLAPINRAFERLQQKRRKRRSVSSQIPMDQYLRYHMVSCVRVTSETLLRGGQFTTLLGPPIWLVNNGSQLHFRDAINNTARVVQLTSAANGFVLKLDKLLEPPHIQTKYPKLSFLEAAQKLGYTESVNLINGSSFESLFTSEYGRPYLIFIVTNDAFDKLSDAFKTRITKPENIDELTKYFKYHVVPNAPVNFSTEFIVRGGGGVGLRTLAGEEIFISCRGGKGDLYVNGRSKIVQRDIQFDGGVAFGVDTVLLPLGLGGKCDELTHDTVNGSCGSCFASVSCPEDTTPVGSTNHGCVFNGDSLGCQPLCLRRRRVLKCCHDYFGSDCQACPGGQGTPCSGRGACADGLAGSGTCTCISPYSGSACERCPDNVRCPAPVSCAVNSGGCHASATCSGEAGNVNCTCNSGYQGDGYYCQMIDRCNDNNGGCGRNSTCHFQGPGQSRCQCKLGYHMVEWRCMGHAPQSMCAVSHGGCSPNARCSDTSGSVVCTCVTGYTGDGRTCEGNIIQVLENTVKVREFYKALHALRPTGEGAALFTKLQSSVVNFTVFAPINNAVGSKKFTLYLLKHHIISGHVSMYHVTDGMTLTTLLGTNLTIRKLDNGEITVNGVAHVMGDIDASNGLIHVLDQVIPIIGPVPPQPTTAPPPTSAATSTVATTSAVTTSVTAPPTTHATETTSAPSTTSKPQTTQRTTQKPSVNHTTQKITKESTPPTQIPPVTKETEPTKPNTRPSSKSSTPQKTKLPFKTTPTGKPVVPGTRKKQSSEGLSSGGTAAVVIVLLLVVAIAAGLIIYCRKRRRPFAAFKYTKEDDTLQYNSEVFDEHASYENPMYDVSEPGPSRICVQHESIDMPVMQSADFHNPLYMLDETEGRRIADDSPPIAKKGVWQTQEDFANPLYEEVDSIRPGQGATEELRLTEKFKLDNSVPEEATC